MIESPIESPVESPCVKTCTLDARGGLCLGCGRTVDEIANWTGMSASERARIMAELPDRMATRAGIKMAATME